MQIDTDTIGPGSDQAVSVAEQLSGKNCVVTGSSRGLGRAIAMSLARHGANVVVNYRASTRAAREVLESIESTEGDAISVQADVSNGEAVGAMVDRVHDAFGTVDVLVNNAGVTVDKRFERLTIEDWQRVIDVNLGGAFHCTKAFYDDLREADHGRVINVSSVVGQQGNYGQVNYAASKSGLFGFTKALALELARDGTTVNCVAPGFTQTEMVTTLPDDVQHRIRDRIPLDRFATVNEVAAAVRFLASEDASYLTGEIINVNGGMYA